MSSGKCIVKGRERDGAEESTEGREAEHTRECKFDGGQRKKLGGETKSVCKLEKQRNDIESVKKGNSL